VKKNHIFFVYVKYIIVYHNIYSIKTFAGREQDATFCLTEFTFPGEPPRIAHEFVIYLHFHGCGFGVHLDHTVRAMFVKRGKSCSELGPVPVRAPRKTPRRRQSERTEALTIAGVAGALVTVGIGAAKHFAGVDIPNTLVGPLTTLVSAIGIGICVAVRSLVERS
jgi:hypothetical protein